ncbi:hypothetical protein [Pimelobacter simplex]|uniref:hypothetical protein n=1 Tax=Nocardioides simplex TaxID=2045 RepID=UPI003AAD9DB4
MSTAPWPVRALVAVAERVPHTPRARRAILAVAGLATAGAVAVAASSVDSVYEGLAPVSGDRASNVRVATIDFLLAAETSFLVVPDCIASAAGEVTCTGTTVDGEVLSSRSPADDPDVVEIRVGEKVVYAGSIADVLADAAEGR